MLKFSASYLEKQKSFIPKKNLFLAVVNKTKKLCLLTQFSGKVLGQTMIKELPSFTLYFVEQKMFFLEIMPLLKAGISVKNNQLNSELFWH